MYQTWPLLLALLYLRALQDGVQTSAPSEKYYAELDLLFLCV